MAALLSCGGLAVASPAQAADPVTVNLIDVNDFHGRIDANTVKVAGTVEQLRAVAGEANTLFLSAGDNVGASLFASSSQKDQPTIDVLDALDLAASAVGNHELDGGETDLTGRLETEADYQHVAANIYRKGTQDPVLPEYETYTVAGQEVAVIGAITEETASLVSPAGIANLTIGDPVEAVNRVVDELQASADKPDVIVAMYHEGAGFGTPEGATLADEVADGGAFADIVTKTDADVDAIFTGHTHKQYVWDAPVPGVANRTRPVVQTGSYGENVGQVQLKVDPATGDVVSYTAGNVKRTTADDAALVSQFPRVAAVKTIVDDALAKAAALGNQPVASVTADITTAFSGSSRDDRANESTLGNLVADALLAQVSQLEAGADLGLVNPGGLRNELYYAGSTGADADVNKDGVITFAEANAVLPFNNTLSSVALKGSSLKKVLEQQWQRNADGTVPSRSYLQLGTSENVRYTYDASRPEGERITSVTIDGQPLDLDRTYKVATFSFLGAGGDNFRAFTEGTNTDTGLQDYSAWMDYLAVESPVAPDFKRHAIEVSGDTDVADGGTLALTFPKLNLTSKGTPAATSVSASLDLGGTVTDLGSFPASAGSATVTSGPLDVTGPTEGTLTVTAQPTGLTFQVPVSVGKAASTVASTVTGEAPLAGSLQLRVTPTSTEAVEGARVEVRTPAAELVGTALVDGGVAEVEVPAAKVGVGTKTLSVSFTGTSRVLESRTTQQVTVVKNVTTTQIDVPATVARGEKLAGTVAVDAAPGSVPSGDVSVLLDEQVVATTKLAKGAAAFELDTTAVPTGAHTLTVRYLGDAGHDVSSDEVSVEVEPGASTVSVEAPASVAVGSALTVKVAVTSSTGVVPTGDVDVLKGDQVVGTATLGAEGTADVAVDAESLSVGVNALTVAYDGDAEHASSSKDLSVTVTALATTLKATGYAGTYGKGGSVTITGPTAATGTVTLTKGSTRLGTAQLVKGRAVVKVSGTALTPGAHTLTASYAGNGTYAGATTTVRVTVAKARTSIAAKVTTRKVVVKKTRATVAVTVRASGVTVTGGTVGVYQGAKRVGVATVKNGKATVRLSRLTKVGTQRLTVKYAGNALVSGSSTTVKVKVARR